MYSFPIHHVKIVNAMNAYISIYTFASIIIYGIYGIYDGIYRIYGIYKKRTPGALPECSGSALSVYSVTLKNFKYLRNIQF